MKSKRIVVTRAKHQARSLASLLEERGAVPVLYPCIAIATVEDTAELDRGIEQAVGGRFDWVAFTSANTVLAVCDRLNALGLAVADLGRARIAGIGPGTANAIKSYLGLDVAVVPDEHEAEHLADVLSPVAGTRVFLPQSDIARPILAKRLTEAGAEVTAIAAYRTVVGSGGADVPQMLVQHEVDAITFTSSSTVGNFLKRLAAEGGDSRTLDRVCIACLGRKTTKTAKELGMTATVMPPENTLESLVAELERYFSAL